MSRKKGGKDEFPGSSVMESVWQDREIRFDMSNQELALRSGEKEIDSLDTIEDTKGNNGQRGTLVITNLRMIWYSHNNPALNLSIGYNCILNITIHTAQSILRGNTQALFILTKFNDAKFEFIFTNMVRSSPRLFTTVQAVHRAYETSRLYRDLKLRGAIIQGDELMLLPQENIFSKESGVWNLSSEQGNLGTLVVTNVRVVWYAKLAENFNVSVPFLQIRSIRVRDSKFGKALVIETSPTQNGAGFVLGFRVDPAEKLPRIYEEISNLHSLFTAKPVFGVDHESEEKPPTLSEATIARVEEKLEVLDTGDEISDAFAAYYADEAKTADREVIFSPELGLAIEKPRDGVDLKSLWKLL